MLYLDQPVRQKIVYSSKIVWFIWESEADMRSAVMTAAAMDTTLANCRPGCPRTTHHCCLAGGLSRSASSPCRMDSLHLGQLPRMTAPSPRGDDLSPASLERLVKLAKSPPQQGAAERPPHAVDWELDLPPTPLPHFDRRVVPPNAPLMRFMPFGPGAAPARSLNPPRFRSRPRCVSRSPPKWKELQVERPPYALQTATVFLSAPLFVSTLMKTSALGEA
jgi:hypothetical protein